MLDKHPGGSVLQTAQLGGVPTSKIMRPKMSPTSTMCTDVEVEHGTIRFGVTTQGSPVESRYLASAILPARLSGLSSRRPALVFDRVLSLHSAAAKLDHLENDTPMQNLVVVGSSRLRPALCRGSSHSLSTVALFRCVHATY